MAHTACLVCFISTVMDAAKKEEKRENALKDVALVAGTQQNLSNLYSLDIYVCYINKTHFKIKFYSSALFYGHLTLVIYDYREIS
jgi:hypothetical protein